MCLYNDHNGCLRQVAHGILAHMDGDTKEITDILNHIVANMATKDDLLQLDDKVESLRAEMHEGFASVHAEIREIRMEIVATSVGMLPTHQQPAAYAPMPV